MEACAVGSAHALHYAHVLRSRFAFGSRLSFSSCVWLPFFVIFLHLANVFRYCLPFDSRCRSRFAFRPRFSFSFHSSSDKKKNKQTEKCSTRTFDISVSAWRSLERGKPKLRRSSDHACHSGHFIPLLSLRNTATKRTTLELSTNVNTRDWKLQATEQLYCRITEFDSVRGKELREPAEERRKLLSGYHKRCIQPFHP